MPTSLLDESGSLDSALNSLNEGLQVIAPDWRYLYLNDAAIRHSRARREDLIGKTMMECYPGIENTELFAMLTRCMNERVAATRENEFVYPDGQRAWFEIRAMPAPAGIIVLSIDVSERKRLEASLRQAQKMDALGRLAGGVAHDFNNMLTVITSYASFLRSELAGQASLCADVDEILSAVDKSARLSSQLLTFGRSQPISPRVVSLNDIVRGVDALLRRVIDKQIAIKVIVASDLHPVRLDVNAFEQVLVNLALNARDAMPAGGTITLETDNVTLDDAYTMGRGGLVPPGEYVRLVFSDTGHGMSPEVQQHLFEPFFTTKKVGEGNGLGLATAYGIIRQAGGFIWVYSEVGRGTAFKIYLPRVREGVDASEPKPAAIARTGAGLILLVEDDKQVRTLIARALGRAGYEVVTTSDANEAEEQIRRRDGRVDLLLTDVVMPGRSGVELHRQMVERYPHLRVLFMSGYTKNALEHRSPLASGIAMLQKPFTPEDLLRAVAEVLTK